MSDKKALLNQEDLSQNDQNFSTISYESPKFIEIGSVEQVTHGSREQTSDEPGSGYQGG